MIATRKMCTNTYVCIKLNKTVLIYIYIYIHTYIYIYLYIIHMCIYIYIYISTVSHANTPMQLWVELAS